MKKNQNAATLIILTAIVVVTALVFALGIPLSKVAGVYDLLPIKELYSYGTDFKEGTYALLNISLPAESQASSQELIAESVEVFRERINSLGVYNPEIEVTGDGKVKIVLPYLKDNENALDTLIKKSELSFQDENGNILIGSKSVKSATYATFTDSYGLTQPAVKIEFDEEGTALFTQATSSLIGKYLYIMLDDEAIRAPYIDSTIDTGVAYISGLESKQDAIQLASVISSGSLPADFTVEESGEQPASFGEGALKAVVYGCLGVTRGLCIVMIVVYSGLGFAGALLLSLSLLISFLIFALLGTIITLYSVIGIIISAILTVYTIINTMKQIKKEAILGKSALASVRSGWKNSKNHYWKVLGITAVVTGSLYCFIQGALRYALMTTAIASFVTLIVYVALGGLCFKAAVSATEGRGIFEKKQDK